LEVWLHTFLTSAIDVGVVSFTPLPLYPREIDRDTHWIGGRIGPLADLDAVLKRKNSQPLSGLELPIIQPIAQHYTTEFYWILIITYVLNTKILQM
jgi:hypothetical protein